MNIVLLFWFWFWLLTLSPVPNSWAVETTESLPQHSTTASSESKPSADNTTYRSLFNQTQWSLNDTEWQRYLTLMQGIRGSISQANLSPLEVLGIHAETESERRDYAGRLAKMVQEDTERVLAFSRVYQEEARKITPNPALINKTLLNLTASTPKHRLEAHDRLLFFTRLNGCSLCNSQLAALLNAINRQDVQLDIYLIDANNDEAIQIWANRQSLDKERLTHKTITLNHDHGTLTRVAGIAATVPKTLLMRGTSVTVIEPSTYASLE